LHAIGYGSTPDAKVVAVADTITALAEERARELGASGVYDSAEKLLKDENVEAVDICVPGAFHAPIAVAAAESEKHILLEKPMATSVEGCDSILSAARRAGVTIMMAHSLRFFPPLVKCKELVDGGGVGRMIKMRATLTSHFPYMGWRLDPGIAGGGVLTEYGVHPIYLTDWFIGPIARAYTFTGTSSKELKTEDVAVAVLEARNGAYGVIDVNLDGPFPLWDDHLEFVGSKGLIVLNGIEMQILRGPAIMHYKDDSMWQMYRERTYSNPEVPSLSNEVEWKYTSAFVYEIREFASAILEGRAPLTTGEDGRRSIQILQACYESARTGKAVTIQ
jgi:UDP-N-acetylglucosamine 3-dehydrogenase